MSKLLFVLKLDRTLFDSGKKVSKKKRESLLKTALIIILFISFVIGAESYPLSFDWQKAIAPKENKSVLDYYHLLPDLFFDPEGMSDDYSTIESRDSLIKTKDISNGYIKFNETSEITLYKDRKNHRDIIAIQIWKYCAGCNVPDGNRILQFDSATNRWISMDSLLPNNLNEIFKNYNRKEVERFPYFDLPQHGTSILIRDENTEIILDTLFWNGSSFIFRK